MTGNEFALTLPPMQLGLDDFKSYIAAVKSDNTAVAYHKGAVRFVRFLKQHGLTIPSAPRNVLQQLVATLAREGIQPRSIKLYTVGARRFLTWLQDQGIDMPDFIEPELPRPESKKAEVIDAEVLSAWIQAASHQPEPFRTFLTLLPFVGLRVEEACKLKIVSIQQTKQGGLSFSFMGKGKKTRRVPISSEACNILREYGRRFDRRQSEWLFPALDPYAHIKSGEVRKHVQLTRADAGMPWITAHKLRHVFATLLSKNGVSLEVIKELLGHASIQTTSIYVHPNDDQMIEAVEHVT